MVQSLKIKTSPNLFKTSQIYKILKGVRIMFYAGRQGTLVCLLHQSPKFSVKTFQPLIVIYRRGNFVYHHWANIYWQLSYSFKFLVLNLNLLIRTLLSKSINIQKRKCFKGASMELFCSIRIQLPSSFKYENFFIICLTIFR